MATRQQQHTPRKIYQDFNERYGDGGGGPVEYPVWFCDSLRVPEEVRRRLALTLRSIDRSRMDVQPNGIVRDIIDPSLNARMLDEAERAGLVADEERRASYVQYAGDDLSDEDGDGDGDGDDANEDGSTANLRAEKINHLNMVKARGAFQWVPTVARCIFNEDDDAGVASSAAFIGDIAGLPERRFCEHLYADLERVLSEMMPFLAKVPLKVNKWKAEVPNPARHGGDLQVVVKAQRYILPPHSTYTGRWHTEGFSENIVAAGVYYVDVSAGTTGGNLSFRPRETPDAGYFLYRSTNEGGYGALLRSVDEEGEGGSDGSDDKEQQWWHHYVKDVPVGTGTAAVFSNSIPHRFRSIRNDTDEPQQRLFVNFFFVNPRNPLECTTSSRPSPCTVRRVLLRMGIHAAPIQQQVLDFVGGYTGSDFLHRKVTRDRARAAMSSNRPHWSVQHFGNSGCIVYHWNNRSLREEGRKLGEGYNLHYTHENYSRRELEHSGCDTSNLGSGF